MQSAVIGSFILLASQSVFSQMLPVLQHRVPSSRVCMPHQPSKSNQTSDPFACQRELDLVSNLRDPEADKTIIQISEENGYSIQSHNVTTSDGYIIAMFRISGGRNSPAREGKPVVLLLHGWGSSCESWIALPNDKSLAYMLVNAGYDIWLGCHRGSSFSLGHRTLNHNTDVSFWDFSFHQMGLYDFPVMLDQARLESRSEKIFVIAHSQGGAAFLIAAAEIPSISKKIHAAYLMAPAAYMGGSYDPVISTFLPIAGTSLEESIYRIFSGRFQVRNTSALATALGIRNYDIGQPEASTSGFCNTFTLGPYYFNPAQMNYTNLPRVMSKLFDTLNIRSAIHFGQNVRSCSFRQYDYGLNQNLKRYGVANPPRYNLSRIQTPMYIMWGEQDSCIPPSDIQRLANALPSSVLREVIRVNDDSFNHVDFIVARDANVLVYKLIIDKMNEFLEGITGTK